MQNFGLNSFALVERTLKQQSKKSNNTQLPSGPQVEKLKIEVDKMTALGMMFKGVTAFKGFKVVGLPKHMFRSGQRHSRRAICGSFTDDIGLWHSHRAQSKKARTISIFCSKLVEDIIPNILVQDYVQASLREILSTMCLSQSFSWCNPTYQTRPVHTPAHLDTCTFSCKYDFPIR